MTPAKLWPAAVIAVLALTVVANAFLLYEAHDRDAAVVEPDYYRKAVGFDSTLADRRRSDALGWHVAVELGTPDADGNAALHVSLTDRDGAPLAGAEVRATAIHNRLAAHAVTATLAPVMGDGYATRLPLRLRGLWQLDLAIRRGADRFVTTLRCDTGSRAAR